MIYKEQKNRLRRGSLAGCGGWGKTKKRINIHQETERREDIGRYTSETCSREQMPHWVNSGKFSQNYFYKAAGKPPGQEERMVVSTWKWVWKGPPKRSQEATLAPHLHLLPWLLTGGMEEAGEGEQPIDFVDLSLQGTEQGKQGRARWVWGATWTDPVQ